MIRAFIFALVGLALLAWAGSDELDGRRALSWPETTGVIEESQGGDPKKPAMDHLTLRYAYTVDGTRHVGHRFRFGHNGGNGTRIASLYPVGRTVPVYYDPADPTNAVLDRKVEHFQPRLLIVIGLAMLALAVGVARSARAERRKEEEEAAKQG